MRHDSGETASSGVKGRGRRVFRWVMLLAIFILPVLFMAACKANLPSSLVTPTLTPSEIVYPRPTQPPTASPTQAETPTGIPTTYDLPAWMGDPRVVILIDLIMKSNGQEITVKLSFLNVETGEWFYMQIPPDARKYFWFDNMHFGFLSNDLQLMYLIDTSNGFVSRISVFQQQTRYLSVPGYFAALKIRKEPSVLGGYTFQYAYWFLSQVFSKSGRYSAERDTSVQGSPVSVTDQDTGQIVWQSNPADGYWDNSFAWSPAEDTYLAIVEGKDKDDKTFDFWFPVKDTALIVQDIKTGQIIASLKDDIGHITWSPDGTYILYKNAISAYWNFGYGFTKAPCIFNIYTGENRCIWNILMGHIPAGYTLETTDKYQWSPDGKSIYYVYEYGSTTGMRGDLCIYNLWNGNITCPTDNLIEVREWPIGWANLGWSIHNHDFSPDGKYVYFCYSSNSLLSDDQAGPSMNGLININGTGLVTWAGQVFEEDSLPKCSAFGPIWRPLP